MPRLAVEQNYAFDGPTGRASLLDHFAGRQQLIVDRAFLEPGVHGWPDHACPGCSRVADQVAHVAHLNARDTTLVFVSRAPQPDIRRVKARMGWYTLTDGFDAASGVDEWHGTNAFLRDGGAVFRTYFINNRGDEAWGVPATRPIRRGPLPGGAPVLAAIVLGGLLQIILAPDRMIDGVVKGLIVVSVIAAAAEAMFRVAGWTDE